MPRNSGICPISQAGLRTKAMPETNTSTGLSAWRSRDTGHHRASFERQEDATQAAVPRLQRKA